jgi:hypothetical protein
MVERIFAISMHILVTAKHKKDKKPLLRCFHSFRSFELKEVAGCKVDLGEYDIDVQGFKSQRAVHTF